MNKYVHGYSPEETTRLTDQANTLEELIHHDTIFPANETVLEAGCGTGAQTKIIARKNPSTRFISIDISPESVHSAQKAIISLGIINVELETGNIFKLKYSDISFDHIFVCFVLEHLSEPDLALKELKRVLKPGGTITIIEGDHGSTYFHPDSVFAQKAIECQVQLQKQKGGDANIGRRLYPLLVKNGFRNVEVSPRQVYADASKPGMVEGFTRNTFTAMIKGIRKDAIESGLSTAKDFDQGIQDLYHTAEKDGTYCYTFFKATALK